MMTENWEPSCQDCVHDYWEPSCHECVNDDWEQRTIMPWLCPWLLRTGNHHAMTVIKLRTESHHAMTVIMMTENREPSCYDCVHDDWEQRAIMLWLQSYWEQRAIMPWLWPYLEQGTIMPWLWSYWEQRTIMLWLYPLWTEIHHAMAVLRMRTQRQKIHSPYHVVQWSLKIWQDHDNCSPLWWLSLLSCCML